MHPSPRGLVAATLAAGIVALHAAPASAALGGNLAESERGTEPHELVNRYANMFHPDAIEVRARKHPGGVVVAEYANVDGTVFALAWRGPRLPDMKRVLGEAAFRRWTGSPERLDLGPAASAVVTEDLAVYSFGQMHALHGRAWLPRAMPEGFKPQDIEL